PPPPPPAVHACRTPPAPPLTPSASSALPCASPGAPARSRCTRALISLRRPAHSSACQPPGRRFTISSPNNLTRLSHTLGLAPFIASPLPVRGALTALDYAP